VAAGLHGDTAYSAEIRAVLRVMPYKDRLTLLSTAMKDKNVEILSAVFNAPSILT
jgi:hypothetical protein